MLRTLFSLQMFFSLLVTGYCTAMETITFKASDGITITADLYMAHDNTVPFIVLFHQANWSRGEYLEIAPKLNAMGFNCMAVDLRSGGGINGIPNKTKVEATKAMKGTNYVDALVDMQAAIAFAIENFAGGKLIIWGSSYSSALVLKMAGDNPDQIDGALAFAPGEYFSNLGKSKEYVTTSARNIQQPIFITSAKGEKNNWWRIYEAIPSADKQYYLPTTTGNHGSRALWEKFGDSKGYWEAVTSFLESLK